MKPDDPMAFVALAGQHLALAPVAFAMTEGPTHALINSNSAFRQLLSTGEISIGPPTAGEHRAAADLAPVLDRAFQQLETIRDEPLVSGAGCETSWTCTVWFLSGLPTDHDRLIIEVRDTGHIEGARIRQRQIAGRLLVGALRAQDVAREAVDDSGRARFLASASRDLSMSLDETSTRDTVRRLTLPRAGSWCIVDVIESNGGLHRLAVVHPDPAKQALARSLEAQWPPLRDDPIGAPSILPTKGSVVIDRHSVAALTAAAHGPENLRILRELGFGSLLVVPLVVRAVVRGAITFVNAEDDDSFTPQEIALAEDLAAHCAMALDNARLYREADALRLSAEAANRAKSEFMGRVSHELRTPLNAIGGFTDLLEMGLQGPVTPAQLAAFARIKHNQQHLLTLITEILDFVRVESGRMEYTFEEVSLVAAFDDVADLLGGIVAEKGLVLERPGPETHVKALADASRVRQILLNLVMNAVKYAAVPGGAITLTCSLATNTVVSQVSDDGPGIPPERLTAIFEPFVQLAASLSNQEGGVGLGLAISRDLARAMHGDLTVDSVVGVGSRFTLTLPAAAE